jgi:TRAP-type uncharacterized transport system fused permease subunit
MAVYDPALMLQPLPPSTTVDVAAAIYVTFKALVAIALWGGAAIGYLRGPLNWIERIVALAAAALLVAAVPWTDEAGFALGAGFIAWHGYRSRKARPAKT